MTHRFSRRKLVIGGVCAAGASVAADAFGLEPRWLAVTHHDVACKRLPPELAGATIAQLSDLHLTATGSLHQSVLDQLRTIQPSVVVFTGDLTEDASHLPACEAFMRGVAATAREALAVSGNWEHWGGIPRQALQSCYERAGFRLLGNENLRLRCGLVVAATDDDCSGHCLPELAMHHLPQGPRLLLTHAPGWLEHARERRFDVLLAGHTHGGQLTLAGRAVALPPGSGKYTAGWYPTPLGSLYVSKGLGTSVVPARFGCRPELAVFRLLPQP